uniref:Uncharacterized LOC100176726 n=1 Tax=Ciona intestinalis TaxID=7719 RepID=H2XUD2_CIOIN|nr:uncharacterized protein LOC100176726 [Ciona intestinalis]|eukprot:XP_002129311.1 uncharacterized protein LOC100176726 [Ciona intestinalis]
MAGLLKSITDDKALENNMELLQQIALRASLQDEGHSIYRMIATARIGNELYQRVTGKRKIMEYKKQCIANITAFIQNNPKASNNVLKQEVENQIAIFAVNVSTISVLG